MIRSVGLTGADCRFFRVFCPVALWPASPPPFAGIRTMQGEPYAGGPAPSLATPIFRGHVCLDGAHPARKESPCLRENGAEATLAHFPTTTNRHTSTARSTLAEGAFTVEPANQIGGAGSDGRVGTSDGKRARVSSKVAEIRHLGSAGSAVTANFHSHGSLHLGVAEKRSAPSCR